MVSEKNADSSLVQGDELKIQNINTKHMARRQERAIVGRLESWLVVGYTPHL